MAELQSHGPVEKQIAAEEIPLALSFSTPEASKQDAQLLGAADPAQGVNKNAVAVEANDDTQYPSSTRLGLILLALCLAIFLTSLDMTIVSTAIPAITDEFNSLDDIGWYGSAFFLTLAAFQSPWGKVYKYFPLKWAYLVAIFVFELGSLVCGVAQNSPTLIVGRAFAGIGGAGILSGSFTIIAFAVEPVRRPAFTGFVGASYGIASVVGPLVGGAFTTNVTWRWCFYINLPIGALSAVVIAAFFQTPEAAKPVSASFREKILQIDILGILTIIAAVICYLLALQRAGISDTWNSSVVVGLLVGFVLLFAVFCVLQWRLNERAMVVPRLLKDRTIWAGMAFIFFLASCSWLFVYYIPIYFQVIDGVSAANSGVRTIPTVIGMTVGTIIAGGAITSVGYHVPFLVLSGAMSVAGAALLYTLDIGTGSPAWIGYQALAGLGFGFGIQVPIMAAQALMAPEDVSTATAMILFSQTLGGSLCISAAQSAFVNTIIKSLSSTAPDINPLFVVATGATQIRNVFPPQTVPAILRAYMSGLKNAFAIGIAAAAMMLLIAGINKWHNLKLVNEEEARMEKEAAERMGALGMVAEKGGSLGVQ
ncbi:hypothetical protein MMC30_002470 [Trapelia coarctata]|nr:hypothetical protein [Trapelia coarctata]